MPKTASKFQSYGKDLRTKDSRLVARQGYGDLWKTTSYEISDEWLSGVTIIVHRPNGDVTYEISANDWLGTRGAPMSGEATVSMVNRARNAASQTGTLQERLDDVTDHLEQIQRLPKGPFKEWPRGVFEARHAALMREWENG